MKIKSIAFWNGQDLWHPQNTVLTSKITNHQNRHNNGRVWDAMRRRHTQCWINGWHRVARNLWSVQNTMSAIYTESVRSPLCSFCWDLSILFQACALLNKKGVQHLQRSGLSFRVIYSLNTTWNHAVHANENFSGHWLNTNRRDQRTIQVECLSKYCT